MYFLLNLADGLDLSAIIGPARARDPHGQNEFDPQMLTLLLLYAYSVGFVYSRKIKCACYRDLAFRVLIANQQTDHSRVSEFRHRNVDALKGLIVQILRRCQMEGMGHVAIDGTKVQANDSKRNLITHKPPQPSDPARCRACRH